MLISFVSSSCGYLVFIGNGSSSKKLGLIQNWANIFLLDRNWREIWVFRKILLHTVVVVVVVVVVIVVVVMREMVFPWKMMMVAPAAVDRDEGGQV